MIVTLRKHQQKLMIIVSVLVTVAFIWLYNDVNPARLGTDKVASIYGRSIVYSEMERSARVLNFNAYLGLYELLQGLTGGAQTEAQAQQNFLFNNIILKKEAYALGIHPTQDEIADAIRTLPVFQTDGQFDMKKYSQFSEKLLGPNGFTEAQLEDSIRTLLVYQKLNDIIGSGAATSDREARDLYDRSQRKIVASVIRLSQADVAGKVTVPDEEIQKTYEAKKDTFKTEEKRRVRFVRIMLSEEEQKLENRERVNAMQKLSDHAGSFVQAMLEPGADFDKIAKKFDLKVETSSEFSQSQPDPAFSEIPALTPAAFALTKEDPNSDAVSFKEGFYILHLDHLTEARQETFEEAKAQVAAQLQAEKTAKELSVRGDQLSETIQAGLDNGSDISTLAAKEGVAIENLPAFSLTQPDTQLKDWQLIAMATLKMQIGQMSSFIPTADGGLLVFLEKYEPTSDEAFNNEKAQIAESIVQHKRNILFAEWLQDRRADANIRTQ